MRERRREENLERRFARGPSRRRIRNVADARSNARRHTRRPSSCIARRRRGDWRRRRRAARVSEDARVDAAAFAVARLRRDRIFDAWLERSRVGAIERVQLERADDAFHRRTRRRRFDAWRVFLGGPRRRREGDPRDFSPSLARVRGTRGVRHRGGASSREKGGERHGDVTLSNLEDDGVCLGVAASRPRRANRAKKSRRRRRVAQKMAPPRGVRGVVTRGSAQTRVVRGGGDAGRREDVRGRASSRGTVRQEVETQNARRESARDDGFSASAAAVAAARRLRRRSGGAGRLFPERSGLP